MFTDLHKNVHIPQEAYHKQLTELHYLDNNLKEAHTPANAEVANVMHKTLRFLRQSCHLVYASIKQCGNVGEKNEQE